jgi:mRNA-degrading endonuclease RelE of RelBE toxin-antitoxin system
MNKTWKVLTSKKTDKQAVKLSQNILLIIKILFEDLKTRGPALPDWPNYGKLNCRKSKDKRHCHLQKGKPTYVCCWEVIDKKQKVIKVYYVGTHEKAPY